MPTSLKLLHKFTASMCLVVIGIHAHGFNSQEVLAKYAKQMLEESGANTRRSQDTSRLVKMEEMLYSSYGRVKNGNRRNQSPKKQKENMNLDLKTTSNNDESIKKRHDQLSRTSRAPSFY